MAYDNITQLDSLEHNTIYGGYNSAVRIDDTHFIVAYAGYGTEGHLSTFSIDASGENITEIDQLEFDSSNGTYNSLVKLDATHFAVAYRGNLNGRIEIVSIDGSYDNITTVGALTHDASTTCIYNSLVAIDSTHLILAYYDVTLGDGVIKTFSIDGSYNITEEDKLTHDSVKGEYNSLVMIDSTHFILAYSGDGADGYIKTFSIDGSYTITEIDSLEHDTVQARYNSIALIDSTHFILAYSSLGDDGYIKTFSIDGSYDNITEIDSLEFEVDLARDNSIIKLADGYFMLAYSGKIDYDGYICTISIDGSYDNITIIETLEHDIDNCFYNSLIEMKEAVYALAYAGTGNDGFVKTFSIDIDTATIDEVSGVAVADIAQIDGVDVADISEIDGVEY